MNSRDYFKSIYFVLFFTMVTLLPWRSFALIIGTGVEEGGPNAVCLVVLGQISGNVFHRIGSCSGALIDSKQVVTAGHCVEPLIEDKGKAIKVYCGYQPPNAMEKLSNTLDRWMIPQPLLDTKKKKPITDYFTETLLPESIYLNPKYSQKNVPDKQRNDSDFAVINLTESSAISPLQLLRRDETLKKFDIQEGIFASALRNGKEPWSEFECAESGFGIDNENLVGKLNTAGTSSSFTDYYRNGMIVGNKYLRLQSEDDISHWLEMNPDNGRHTSSSSEQSKTDLLVDEFMFLNSRQVIKSSLMPGDSGGPLYCRDNKSSPWMVAAVASYISLANRGFAKDDSYVIQQINGWVMPDLTQVTQRVWPNL